MGSDGKGRRNARLRFPSGTVLSTHLSASRCMIVDQQAVGPFLQRPFQVA